jgi:hypothetical protein
VLYEISAPGGSNATAAQIEADTGLAVPVFLNVQHTAVAGFFPYGRVMYEHGGGSTRRWARCGWSTAASCATRR